MNCQNSHIHYVHNVEIILLWECGHEQPMNFELLRGTFYFSLTSEGINYSHELVVRFLLSSHFSDSLIDIRDRNTKKSFHFQT
jgi:hypothetical protein